MYGLFSVFFPILTSFSLKSLTINHSYIMVYYVFLIRVCDDHSATWHFYLISIFFTNKCVTTTVPLGTFYMFKLVIVNSVFGDTTALLTYWWRHLADLWITLTGRLALVSVISDFW